MKKSLIFLAVLLSGIAFAEKAEIKFIAEDGSATSVFFEKEESCIVIDAKKFPTKKLDSITGFENFPNLDSLTFYFLRYTGDYDFLAKIPRLKELGLIGCYVSSLNFIENIYNLETIELELTADINNFDKLQNTEINLKKLIKLQKIFVTNLNFGNIANKEIWNYKQLSKLNFIPKFINVQNKPELSLTNNKIETLTKKEIKLLRQFSTVDLSFNPIAKNKQELERLKKAKINFEAY